MATLTIQEIPIGSQYTESIGTDDPAVLNDFAVRFVMGRERHGSIGIKPFREQWEHCVA